MNKLVVLLALAALAGCSVIQPPVVPMAEPAALSAQPQPVIARGTAGGVYAANRGASLTSDTRALRAGDVVTVVLMETTQASKKADTSFGKESNFGINLSSKGKVGIDATTGAQRGFDGNASSSQQNTLQGAITVVVQDVLPNGLLRVAGDKSLYLNQGEEVIRLSGYIRAADVDAENRVSSQRIASARIVYSGQGSLADANTPGWLTRFFSSPLMPL